MSYRHRHHTRSTSYPESINLSLLSFSRSLSTVPSLSSESIIASLSSVSFPEHVSTPVSVTLPTIIPLKDNILALSSPSYIGPTDPDSPSSNEDRPLTRITIAAPTSPRIKQIKEEPSCVTKWVDALPRVACPPGHIPWAGAKVTRELDWIPEGSMFPPNLYSKVISDIRARVLRRDASQAPARAAKPLRARLQPEDHKGSTTPVTTPKAPRDPSAKTRIPLPVSRGTAPNVTKADPKPRTALPRSSKVGPQKRRPAPIITQGSVPYRKCPQTHQLSISGTHTPTAHSQSRRKRTSIPTSDMINTLRVQMATLSANTPPPDQTSHNITSTADLDASIPNALRPSSKKTQAPNATSQISRTPKEDVNVDKPYPTENDFGTRLSTIYPLSTPKNSTLRQPSRVAKLVSRPTFHSRAHPTPRRDRGSTSTFSISNASTSCSDGFASGPRTARGGNDRIASRRHRSSRTQIFVPRKLPPLFGLPARSTPNVKADGGKRNAHSTPAPQLSAHGSLSSIMISKAPFKEVRFAPLPTTIRRYPPEPSDASEDDASVGMEETGWLAASVNMQRARKPVPNYRSLPRNPWAPDLSANVIDFYDGEAWSFVNASSRYPPIAREPLSAKYLDINVVPSAKPVIAASSPKFSSSACNPLLPLIRLSESESAPNTALPSSSSMLEVNSPRKYSFTRRSLSRIMPLSIREGSKPGSIGIPTFSSQRGIANDNNTHPERGFGKEGGAVSARSRLPRLRLGNIFSRMKQ